MQPLYQVVSCGTPEMKGTIWLARRPRMLTDCPIPSITSGMSSRPIILFDLDGTLIDSERVAMEVTQKYFEAKGKPISSPDAHILVGRAWEPALKWILELYPLESTLEKVMEEVLTEYRRVLAEGVPEIKGSLAAVRSLMKDHRLGVVSGSHKEDILSVLCALNLEGAFEVVVGFGDYEESKPSPEPYLEALKRMGVKDEKILVFEDSSAGIKAAQLAGLEVVAVGTPPEQDSERPATSWKISNFSEINEEWVRLRARPLRPRGGG